VKVLDLGAGVLMPGVIDTAVQFDPNGDPSIWGRESSAALTGGVTSVVTLPGGDNGVVDRASALRRAERGVGTSWCHFGLWGAVRSDNAEDLLRASKEGLLLGLLAYAGGTDPRVVDGEVLRQFIRCRGVLGVQIDGVAEADDAGLGPTLLRLAREESAKNLHLLHLSTAAELHLLDPVRGDLPVTAGVTPHHLFFSEEGLNGLADRMRTRPPVRPEQDRRTLWTAVKRGRLDCVASDHHPREDAADSGVPGSELLFPLMLSAVKYGRLSLELLVSLCSEAPARIFGMQGKGRIAAGADADLILFTEGELAKVAGDSLLSGAGWSPYQNREAAAKPEMVFLGGKLVAKKGRLTAEEPAGQYLRKAPEN
jgi:dihydroorotase